LEDSTTTRERDSEEAVTLSSIVGDRRNGSSSLEASASSVVAQVHCTIDEQQKSSTPPSMTRIISTDNEEKPKVEVDDSLEMKISDVEMDGVNVEKNLATLKNYKLISKYNDNDNDKQDEVQPRLHHLYLLHNQIRGNLRL